MALLVISQLPLFSQLDCSSVEYEYSTFIEAYQDIDPEQATSLSQGIVWDDPDFEFPIGFDFEFFSFTTSNLMVSGDLLGAGVIGNPDALKSDANAFLPAFSDFTDLAYANFEEGSENGISNISHITEGEEGNRIMKLEWQNVGFYGEVSSGTANNYINVQLWLYEADQSIEFRYGPSLINQEDLEIVFDGIPGPLSGLICSLPFEEGEVVGTLLDGDTSNPFLVEFDEDAYEPPSLEGMPVSGRVYRWERNVISVEENLGSIDLNVFPNPFEELINLNSGFEIESIQITDMAGKVVLESALQCKTCQLNTESLASGIYLVKMKIGSQIISRKITKS